MGMALVKLGYNVLGARLDMAYPLLDNDLDTPIKLAAGYDALQDIPWANLFKELDKAYPGSKFILTVREEQAWLNSALKHFSGKHYRMHEWMYGNGVIDGNEELYLKHFRQHYKDVDDYFKERKDDLLKMDLANGDGWDKLCAFLNCTVPKQAFPHANKGKHSLSKKDKVVRGIKKLIPGKLRRARVTLLEKMGLHKQKNIFNNRDVNEKERGKPLKN